MKFDDRRQRIFIALQDNWTIGLDELAARADVSRHLAARELARLGWAKRQDRYENPIKRQIRAR